MKPYSVGSQAVRTGAYERLKRYAEDIQDTLFEVGADKRVDAVLLVTAPVEVQRERVLSRPGMTETRFEQIKAKQIPDAEKRARAQYVVFTDRPHPYSAQQIRDIADELRATGARNRPGH